MKKNGIVFLQLLPVILSMFMISAHFLRYGNVTLVVVILALLLVLFIRSSISVRLIQATLFLATIEWIHITNMLVSMRMSLGFDWLRMAIILGVVACFTFASMFVFFSKTLKSRYDIERLCL